MITGHVTAYREAVISLNVGDPETGGERLMRLKYL